jgi:hypothetical protein
MAFVHSVNGLKIKVSNLRFQQEWTEAEQELMEQGDAIERFEFDLADRDRWEAWVQCYQALNKISAICPEAGEAATMLHNLIQSHTPVILPDWEESYLYGI